MLTDQQYKCIELLIEGQLTQKEIASTLKITEQTICNWKKVDDFKKEKERLLRESFRDVAPKMKIELVNLALKARNEQVRLSALKDILDRAGLKPTDKTELDIGNKDDKPFEVNIKVVE